MLKNTLQIVIIIIIIQKRRSKTIPLGGQLTGSCESLSVSHTDVTEPIGRRGGWRGLTNRKHRGGGLETMEDGAGGKRHRVGETERSQATSRASNGGRPRPPAVFEADKRPIFTPVFRLGPSSLAVSGHITGSRGELVRQCCVSVWAHCKDLAESWNNSNNEGRIRTGLRSAEITKIVSSAPDGLQTSQRSRPLTLSACLQPA